MLKELSRTGCLKAAYLQVIVPAFSLTRAFAHLDEVDVVLFGVGRDDVQLGTVDVRRDADDKDLDAHVARGARFDVRLAARHVLEPVRHHDGCSENHEPCISHSS